MGGSCGENSDEPLAARLTQSGQAEAPHLQRLAIWQFDDGTMLTRARDREIVKRLAMTFTHRLSMSFILQPWQLFFMILAAG